MTIGQTIDSNANKSHGKNNLAFKHTLKKLRTKIIDRGDLPYVTVERQLEIIEELRCFPLGRFIFNRGGANAFWTDYLLSYYNSHGHKGLNIEGKPFSSLEIFILNHSPVTVASQERFRISQNLIQNALQDNIVLASIPCGSMRDLLTLDYSKVSSHQLYGIDYDQESISLAQKLARKQGIKKVIFYKENAWKIPFYEMFDVIASNGLNVYEPDRKKVIDLYKNFLKALKPNGMLIIGILTYPPGETKETDWLLDGMRDEAILMERILYKDILDLKWRNFRSIAELENDFKAAGFRKIAIHYDKHRVFPTIVATKTG